MGAKTRNATTLIAAALMLSACEDGTAPGFDGAGSATLSFTVPTQAPSPSTRFGGPSPVVVTDAQGRTLDVQRIQVVMEELQLKRSLHDTCIEDDDACEYFEIGPVLIDLPVEGGVITPFDTPIPADIYEELELEIDDADDDGGSAAFFAANPGWPREASIRIVGTFDANDGAGPQAFDVFLDVSAEIERELVPPLVITESSQEVNVTVLVDVASWFRDSAGNLLDPRALTASGDMLSLVEDNIEESFDAFEDDDRDGDDDSDDDDGTDDSGSGDV